MTYDEIVAAAECARKYPGERAYSFFWDKDVTSCFGAEDRLLREPECVKFGWPAVVAAAVSGQNSGKPVTAASIKSMLADLAQFVPDYLFTLSVDGKMVANELNRYLRYLR